MSVKRGVYHNDDNVLLALAEIELLSRLKTDVQVAADTYVPEEIKNAIRDSVFENVYDEYTPKNYLRRGDNHGLSDTRNYIDDVYPVSETDTDVTVTVNVNGSVDNQLQNIVPIIETGRGYTWKRSRIYLSRKPRPFLDDAIQTVIKDGSALGAVASYLISRGWEVNYPYKRLHTPPQFHGDPNAMSAAFWDMDYYDDYYGYDSKHRMNYTYTL